MLKKEWNRPIRNMADSTLQNVRRKYRSVDRNLEDDSNDSNNPSDT
jgi:hypothetical protein